MNENELYLLTEPTNYAVVQLPKRQFPGVVIQGDTLSGLCALLDELLSACKDADAVEIVEELKESLGGALLNYESVLKGRGIELPY